MANLKDAADLYGYTCKLAYTIGAVAIEPRKPFQADDDEMLMGHSDDLGDLAARLRTRRADRLDDKSVSAASQAVQEVQTCFETIVGNMPPPKDEVLDVEKVINKIIAAKRALRQV
jgi:hypothetical protein